MNDSADPHATAAHGEVRGHAPAPTPAPDPAPALTAREARWALTAVLLLAAVLRLWRLEQNGWGAEYYSAAVRSMASDWHNFLFAAFDPAGFLSVDKPPVALWLQVLSVKLFGFQPLAVLVPQALVGVAAVWVLYRIVRRGHGEAIALLAALLFAITPVWVAVNRTNNMDSALVLAVLAAAWALLVAVERGSRRHLLGSAALMGLAFNVKMLAAFVVLPAFVLAYLLGAPLPWARRLRDLAAAGAVLVATALPWVMLVALTPADERPHVGSSRENSIFELIVGHNAASRFALHRGSRPSPAVMTPAQALELDSGPMPPVALPPTVSGAGGATREAAAAGTESAGSDTVPAPTSGTVATGASAARTVAAESEVRTVARTLFQRLFVRAPPGPLRLARGQLAAQFLWWLPLALAGLALGLRRAATPTTALPDASRGDPTRAAWLLWSGWAVLCWAVFSHLGGIVHYYYVSLAVPAVAVLAAIGAVRAPALIARQARWAPVLPLLLAVLAAWQLHVQAGAMGWTWEALWSQPESWVTALHGVAFGGVIAAALAVSASFALRGPRAAAGPDPASGGGAGGASGARLRRVGWFAGTTAALLLPLAWAWTSVAVPAFGVMPSADLYRLLQASRQPSAFAAVRFGRLTDVSRLVAHVESRRGDARYALVTSTTQLAAPIIITSGLSVIARGGFHGLDAALSVERLAQLAHDRDVRFAMVGDVARLSRRMGADAADKPVADWIRANGVVVDPLVWRTERAGATAELYELRGDGAEPPLAR
jgi:4-amino-4-deoxy-L-arabinose transferase-like glycosyltransferase